MSRYSDKHIRKDSWVKEMLRTYNPELLAALIEKRIKFSSTTGPYVISDETPTDIINAYVNEGPDDFKEKIEPAVGLLLYKTLHNQMEASNDFLRHVFLIIRTSKLANCRTLLQHWINKNASFLVSNKSDIQDTMRDALMAFAKIQIKDSNTEEYWINLWHESQSRFWPVSFYGLRLQNPQIVCRELPLLASRKIAGGMDKITPLISGMWNDLESRQHLEKAIKNGLNENTGWAGLILNTLFEKLDDKQKNEVIENLKGLP